jgi:integrase
MLRHTAAVWMAEGGTPMSEIAQYLGHSTTLVTEKVYARYSPEYLKKAAAQLEILE